VSRAAWNRRGDALKGGLTGSASYQPNGPGDVGAASAHGWPAGRPESAVASRPGRMPWPFRQGDRREPCPSDGPCRPLHRPPVRWQPSDVVTRDWTWRTRRPWSQRSGVDPTAPTYSPRAMGTAPARPGEARAIYRRGGSAVSEQSGRRSEAKPAGAADGADLVLDCRGMRCPLPVIELARRRMWPDAKTRANGTAGRPGRRP
jgi:hypothetical protein